MTTTPTTPSLPELRGNVLAVNLLRAAVRHDADDLRELLVELNTAVRTLGDPAGGIALDQFARYRAEELLADALEQLGVLPGTTTETMPTTTVAAEVTLMLQQMTVPPDVADALRAYGAGDFWQLSNVGHRDRAAAVALATAAAERAGASSPEAALERLDALREELSAA
ncbi:hypothetical protein ACIRPK_34045 [Kitasatospora sp. NPDC101801]|uniref:hypothetical protein n=1 Tax=Kitasatospora sp. NPDC101801 TaxID=3364103 RepID=UPI0038118DBB